MFPSKNHRYGIQYKNLVSRCSWNKEEFIRRIRLLKLNVMLYASRLIYISNAKTNLLWRFCDVCIFRRNKIVCFRSTILRKSIYSMYLLLSALSITRIQSRTHFKKRFIRFFKYLTAIHFNINSQPINSKRL